MQLPSASILIVDDTQANIDVLVDLLEGYDVAVAVDGPSAIDLAQSQPYDMILLDIMMPGMDGFEVCRMLKADPKSAQTPILFITAKTDEESIEKGFEIGGVDYVTKPFKPRELLCRVATHLELRAMQKDLQGLVTQEVAKRQAQEALAQQQSKMAMMGEMIEAVAQQWKQPLDVIAAESDKLLYGDTSAEALKTLHTSVMTQIRHMDTTLREFQNFLRPDKSAEPFAARQMLDNVAMLMRQPLADARIALQLDVDEGITLYGIPSELLHVIITLINTAKAAFEKRGVPERRIVITAQEATEQTLLTLCDNGAGIAANLLPTLFEQDAAVSGGLGLALCRRIIEAQNGTVTAANTEVGTCFTITLPRG